MLACLDRSRNHGVCRDKPGNPFEGLRKESKKWAKRRLQQMKTPVVSSVDSHDNTEVVKDVNTLTYDDEEFEGYLAHLK